MLINYHVTGEERKRLVKTIASYTGCDAQYKTINRGIVLLHKHRYYQGFHAGITLIQCVFSVKYTYE